MELFRYPESCGISVARIDLSLIPDTGKFNDSVQGTHVYIWIFKNVVCAESFVWNFVTHDQQNIVKSTDEAAVTAELVLWIKKYVESILFEFEFFFGVQMRNTQFNSV